MSMTTKHIAWLAGTGMLLLTAFASTSVHAYILPGIPESGSPAILKDNVKVKYKQKKQQFKITKGKGNDFQYLSGGSLVPGEKLKYTLKYDVDSGNPGSLTIKGKIPSIGITNRHTTLVTAAVDAFAFDGSNLLGFATSGIVCDPVLDASIAGGCTDAESVYVLLDSAWGGLSHNLETFGSSITTIPLPAAVWLFGSGLAFLGATVRRRRKTA